MADVKSVIDSAKRLNLKDETSLEILLGLREKAIEGNPALKDDPDFEPKYEGQTMGAMDEIKALGRRVLVPVEGLEAIVKRGSLRTREMDNSLDAGS